MDITGEYRIPAPIDAVWRALNDPAVLQQCITGCKSLEKLSDTEFKGTVAVKIGPVSASFAGEVSLSDLNPPNGYILTGKGQGGAAGFANGSCKVSLRAEGNETVLTYNADAKIGGKIAQLGARLIDGTVKKYASEFFTKFSSIVAAAQPSAAPATADASVPPPVAAPEVGPAPVAPTRAAAAPAESGGVHPAIWAGGVIAAVGVLLWYFSSR